MRVALCALLLAPAALGPQPALAGPEPPPELVEATEEASARCRDLGGAPEILAGYQTVADLNRDGRADFLINLAKLECAGAWSAFCGADGCPVSAWLSEPGGGHVRFDLGALAGFDLVPGAGGRTSLRAAYRGPRCGPDHEAADDCTRTWTFEENAPETPALDAPEPPAARPEPAPATPAAEGDPPIEGWTLRRVPGSSPVALGMGTGNIATLAAFCLEKQPFLAVTFHERPDADAIALGFAFSQGAVEAEAGFEETAGGAYVVALAEGPLAARLGGRDSEVAVTADGQDEGVLSLEGSTRALRGALADCAP